MRVQFLPGVPGSHSLEDRYGPPKAGYAGSSPAESATMLRIFEPSEKEHQGLLAFEKRHSKKCQGTMEVTFTIIGIGLGVHVRCTHCHKEKNVTDYDNW